MSLFLSIITILVFLALLLVAGMRPLPANMSHFELKRRGLNDELDRLEAARDIDSFLRVIESILLVVTVILLIVTFGWSWGIVIAIVVALEYGAIAHLSFLRRQAQDLYQWKEHDLVRMVNSAPVLFRLIRVFSPHESEPLHAIHSKEELQHLVDQSGDVLSHDQKSVIVHALVFDDKKVSDIMTPKKDIETIKATEFLGPLVLDELHQKGFSHLPVVARDINHVVGILRIEDLLSLDNKRSVTAEKAMMPNALFIHKDDTLQHALSLLLQNHTHIAIVANDERETVGLLTMTDIIGALLGHDLDL